MWRVAEAKFQKRFRPRDFTKIKVCDRWDSRVKRESEIQWNENHKFHRHDPASLGRCQEADWYIISWVERPLQKLHANKRV